MNFIQTYFERRRDRVEAQHFANGYRYAAGALLAGCTVEELDLRITVASRQADHNAFDAGVEKARHNWVRMLRKRRTEKSLA